MNTRGLFLIALVGLWSQLGSALVIYTDINNNPQERAVYRRSLSVKRVREDFVVIPEQREPDSILLKQLTTFRDNVWKTYVAQGCLAAAVCQPRLTGRCGVVQDRLHAAEEAADKSPKVLLTTDHLREGLQRLRRHRDEDVTVVLSGHFSEGGFTGNLGNLTVADIKKIYSEFPDLRAAVTTLHLLGCYTATEDRVTSLWRDAFPNARIIVGFYGPGPGGADPLNLKLIADLVKRDEQFENVRSRADFVRAVVPLKRFTRLNTAISIGDYFQKTDGALTELSGGHARASECQKWLPDAQKNFFLSVLNGVQAVPKNTSDSKLRDYYKAINNHLQCLAEPEFMKLAPETPSPKQLIRLILNKNVVTNFLARHGADLANFDQLLQAMGVSPDLSLARLDLTDREKLIAWRSAVQKYLGTKPDGDQVHRANDLLGSFPTILIDLREDCVPFSWVEPGSRDRSQCFKVEGNCR